MNKKARVFILIFVIIISLCFIFIPFILNMFIDKEELRTTHNQEIFDGMVLNIKMCLASKNPKEDIDSAWLIRNCGLMSDYHCDNIEYDNGNLKLNNCNINNQLFSYENGKIVVN